MFEIQDWGLIEYNEAWDKQKEIASDIQKKRNRNVLVFCEHPTVITIGRAGGSENILMSRDFLKSLGVSTVEIDRGGDVTMHNPKQLVGYPIFNLSSLKEDLHWFLREIENSLIDIISHWGLTGERVEGLTGVWIERKRKIAAIGLHCSRWVTSHGFALNVANNLMEFSYIVPCGITDKAVTSISQELGTDIDIEEVKHVSAKVFEKRFFEKN
ncbi:MAG: lipoyl(octanoyl) transferase LipB [Candidatus Kapabacteria bacterium]|nr:lipoyl(octanoyl) transferase LipB [Ignavibacteriota bacterium]MCW5883373.1 lipoyl(octanoyl) transferase LipB [Candidatus Kapabacteria bacterium]